MFTYSYLFNTSYTYRSPVFVSTGKIYTSSDFRSISYRSGLSNPGQYSVAIHFRDWGHDLNMQANDFRVPNPPSLIFFPFASDVIMKHYEIHIMAYCVIALSNIYLYTIVVLCLNN